MSSDGEVRLLCFVKWSQSVGKDIGGLSRKALKCHNSPPITDMIEELVAHRLFPKFWVIAHMHCNGDHHGVHRKKNVPNFVNLDIIIRTGRWWFAMVEDKSAANSGSWVQRATHTHVEICDHLSSNSMRFSITFSKVGWLGSCLDRLLFWWSNSLIPYRWLPLPLYGGSLSWSLCWMPFLGLPHDVIGHHSDHSVCSRL